MEWNITSFRVISIELFQNLVVVLELWFGIMRSPYLDDLILIFVFADYLYCSVKL